MVDLVTWMYDVEMKMYDVYSVYKCMMYIKRSVYKWALRIEMWDWGCHRPSSSIKTCRGETRQPRNVQPVSYIAMHHFEMLSTES